MEQLPITAIIEGTGVISAAGALIGLNGTAVLVNQLWPVANLAIFVPFRVTNKIVVTKIIIGCGLAAGGNFDAGVYDRFGNRLVSTGATARVGSSKIVVDVADTILNPGLYYMGVSVSLGGSVQVSSIIIPGGGAIAIAKGRIMGILEMSSAHPLPDPVTFASYNLGAGIVPMLSLQTVSY